MKYFAITIGLLMWGIVSIALLTAFIFPFFLAIDEGWLDVPTELIKAVRE